MRPRAENTARNILTCLFRERQASRTQLAQKLGVRKGTVGAICEALIAERKIEAADKNRERNVPLQLSVGRFIGVGIDHDTTGLHVTALNACGDSILDQAFPVPPASSGNDRLRRIIDVVRTVCRREGLKDDIVGIGFSDIGMIDPIRGVSVRAAFFPGWHDMPVQAALAKATNRPVTLLTKAEAICMADCSGRGGLGQDTRVYVMLDRGVGVAVLRGGVLWRGDSEVCGELGHVCVVPNGDICACGNRGCLETVAGSDAIVRKVRSHAMPGDAMELRFDREKLTLTQVIEMAERGYGLAQLAIREAAEAVGNALAQTLMVLGIRSVVCAGSLVKAGALVMKPLETTMRQRCLSPLNRQLDVQANPMEGNFYARGAAFAALQQYFNDL